MRLIASVTLKMKKVILPQFISTLYKHNIDINMINLTESDGKWEDYSIEIIYSAKKDLIRLVDTLKKNGEYFQNITITSTLEDKIKGGVLTISSKVEIENINDISTSLIGGNKLIHEKIDSGLQSSYCASFNSIALISGIKITNSGDNSRYYHLYADSERDSVLIGRFTGKNSFPLVIKYNSIEDMIKTIKGIEENFCCLRIMNNDEDDYLLSNIIDTVSKPLIFKELDENPVHYLAVINAIIHKYSIVPGDTSVGIIGLNNSTVKLTALLVKSGFMKVLGHDTNERQMMSFENRKGLATTIENVISNSDIIMIMDEKITYDYITGFKAGQVVITGITSDMGDAAALKDKGVRDFIRIEETDTLSLLPAMINAIIISGERHFSDDMLTKIAGLISNHMQNKYDLPGLFSSNISGEIENMILKQKN
ncbi:MAG: hypothetical protein CVV49_06380 [Spirochaetae bacterium HGW-Spirochaetae-5]|nr:MAG: hypothetical protein CVV49_06380 [Spirochaetae bacterium HGW-Spirochaetae-5]